MMNESVKIKKSIKIENLYLLEISFLFINTGSPLRLTTKYKLNSKDIFPENMVGIH